MKRLFCEFCAVLVLVSCSIKEDRDPCPCTMVVDLSACGGADVDISLWRGGNLVSRKRVIGRDTVSFDIARDFYYLTALPSEWREMAVSDSLYVGKGSPFVPLMASSSFVDAFDDVVRERVVFRRQYARIILDASSIYDISSGWSFVVRGDVFGVKLSDLSPLQGEFENEMACDGGCVFSTTVPRCPGCPPEISVYQRGKYVFDLNLPAYLESIRYDWNAPDLEDIRLDISTLVLDLNVNIEGWKGVDLEDGSI